MAKQSEILGSLAVRGGVSGKGTTGTRERKAASLESNCPARSVSKHGQDALRRGSEGVSCRCRVRACH